jgi:hypothetical protein|nr:MAG TPA: holin [Caudoviricetes sp.]
MDIRIILVNIIAAIGGFLMPIRDFMVAATVLFGVNFLCGLLADIVNDEEWSWKKAFTFFFHCFIFFGLLVFIHTCGVFMHNTEGALQCVSLICYLAIYLYTVNIVRNLRLIVREGTTLYLLLDFLYYVLTLKFCLKIPYWRDYVKVKTGTDIGADGDKSKGQFGGKRPE